MFPTLLFHFILCRTKHHSGEEAANISWMVCYLMKMMHLRMKATYLLIHTLNLLIQTVQKQTRLLIMILLLLLRVLKSEEPYVTDGKSDISQLLDQLCKM